MSNEIPSSVIEAMVNTADDWAPAGCVGLNKPEISIMVRAALAAAEAMGWKLVPRDCTADMEARGCDAGDVAGCWEAMYDAAPAVKP